MPKKSETKKTEKVKKKAEPVKITDAEYEKKVIELSNQGLTSEKIGENLKRQGIHPSEYSKKISDILRAHNLYKNPDLKNIDAKLLNLRDHYSKNKQDKRAMRDRERIASQLRKLKFYFKEA